MELEVEVTEEVTEECTCEPFVLVRYRDVRQEPTVIPRGTKFNYWANDGWLVVLAGEDEELFAARSNEVLSVEIVE